MYGTVPVGAISPWLIDLRKGEVHCFHWKADGCAFSISPEFDFDQIQKRVGAKHCKFTNVEKIDAEILAK